MGERVFKARARRSQQGRLDHREAREIQQQRETLVNRETQSTEEPTQSTQTGPRRSLRLQQQQTSGREPPVNRLAEQTKTTKSARANRKTVTTADSPVTAANLPQRTDPSSYTKGPLKRRASSDKNKDDSKQRPAKRARLTRHNLARLEKMTRMTKVTKKGKSKDGSDSNSTSTGTSSAANTGSTGTSASTTSTTSSGFAVRAYENGILDPGMSAPPSNLNDIRQRLVRPRDTPSPPESQYERYVEAVEAAETEATIVSQVERLLKHPEPKGYRRVLNKAFTAFPEAGFNEGLSAPQPDIIEGLSMNEYGRFPVRTRIPGAVLYADNPRSITLPHLAGELKGTGKDMRRAALQSRYDGAALVYARNNALAYLQEGDGTTREVADASASVGAVADVNADANADADTGPTGRADITTFTTDGNNLNFYAHYATPIKETEGGTGDRKWEYHQYPIHSTTLTTSYEEHKKGRRWLRNAQDRAEDESHALRDRLTEQWKTKTAAAAKNNAANGNTNRKRKASLSMSSRKELESGLNEPHEAVE